MTITAADFIREDCERVFKSSSNQLEELNNSSVLIAGGTGFVGLWLVEFLSFLNDSFNSGIEIHLLSRNRERFLSAVPHVTNRRYINFIRNDVRSVSELPRNLNYIIHAAGNPDNRAHSTRPFDTITTIAEGTSALLRAADRVANLKMFISLSSGNVYGVQPESVDKIREDFTGFVSSTDLNAVYAEAKRYSESLITAARGEMRLPVCIVRPFSFLGPYQAKDAPWATNNFIFDALHGRSIRILGDGTTIRTIMYGADLALWILTIMVKTMTGRVYNVGSDEGKTLYELASMVSSCFSPRPDVLLNCSMAGTIPNNRIVPDISLACSEFGLKIYTDIKTTIERTIIWNTKIDV